MSYTDLRDFVPELDIELRCGETGKRFWVRVEKLGGGEVGEVYGGIWRYMIFEWPLREGQPVAKGQDLHAGTPVSHVEAARQALDFYLQGCQR